MSGRHSKPSATESIASNGQVSVLRDPNDPDSVIIRTRKRSRKHRHSHTPWRKKHPVMFAFSMAFCILAVLALAGGITLAIAVNRGDVNLHRLFIDTEGSFEEAGAKTSDSGQVVEYKGHTYRYNENVVSFVVIGHDDESSYYIDTEGRSLADTIVVFTLDTKTNKARATVIPRNTWCAVDLFDDEGNYLTTNDMQITLSHGVTLPTPEDRAANTVTSVSRILYNMPINYYFDFGAEVVANATSAVGGVPVKALESIPGANYVEGDEVLLEGDAAYRYVAYRNTDAYESALDRQARQAQFISAFANKVRGLGARGLLDVYNGVSKDIVTNFGVSEVAYLASHFARGNDAQLETVELKGTTSVGKEADGIEYERYHLDKDNVLENTLAAFYVQVD